MSELSFRDRELVALGAALASNCEPCVEYHVAEAQKAGLTGGEIAAAIALADKIRQVPARKVLATAQRLTAGSEAAQPAAAACCAPPVAAATGACSPQAGAKSSCC
jgi:AhpD family alkylhydroperoxidase